MLVAAAVGLIVNRVYPAAAARGSRGWPPRPGVRWARWASPGPRERGPAPVGPAFALMLTLTLVGFSAMVLTAVSAGQVAASWAQVGADANIAVPGLTGHSLTGVTPAQLKVISAVPGVRHVTSVYTASSQGTQTVNVLTGSHSSQPLGIAVVDPKSYAKVAADSPWPGFPGGALSEPHGGAERRGADPDLARGAVRALGRGWSSPASASRSRSSARSPTPRRCRPAAATWCCPGGPPSGCRRCPGR